MGDWEQALSKFELKNMEASISGTKVAQQHNAATTMLNNLVF